MANYYRRRSKIHIPITLSISLMSLNVALMICWIVILSQWARWAAMTIGVMAFTFILAGLSVWLVLSLKEINLNNRQANFVDSVTHELKSPIAALQLYLETLSMRNVSDSQRQEFHRIMAGELSRLDHLISQLLEVGRLDAIGENDEPDLIALDALLVQICETVGPQYKMEEQAFDCQLEPITIMASRIVLQLIFSNLIDNAAKYAGDPIHVKLQMWAVGRGRVQIRITNNGAGIPRDERKKVFQIFYRGGSELERRRKGTGLGLYIVQTLVRRMHGRVSVHDRSDGASGCTFDVELPGRVDDPALTSSLVEKPPFADDATDGGPEAVETAQDAKSGELRH